MTTEKVERKVKRTILHCAALMLIPVLCGMSLNTPLSLGQTPAASMPVPKLEIGIDRSSLSLQREAVQEKTLEDIRALGATWFRDGPTSGSPQGIANYVAEVRRAKQQQLKVLMIISQMDSDYDDALPTNRCGWKEKKLSKIDLDKFAQRLRATFDALKAANLTIDAAEFGSEFDQYCYDADVPSGHAPTPAEIKIWLLGYGRFLKTGAEVLHDPHYFPQAKIVTFGMAHITNAWDKLKEHIETPASVVAMLRNVDGFNFLDNASYHVDGYGSHIYASPNDVDGFVTNILREDEKYLGRDKPVWVTEWGFLDFKAFPNKKGQTLAQAMQEFLSIFDTLHRQIPIGPVMFYRYDTWLTDPAGKLLPSASAISAYTASRQSSK